MSNSRIVTKALAGVEDLLLGEGTVTQIRNGTLTNITKINASDLPYNANLSIRDKLVKKPEILNTVAEMQLLNTSLEAEIYVYLLGYFEAGDGGGGLFWLDSSDTSSIQDNNLIFYPDTLINGRWKRINTQNQISPDNGDADLTIESYSERIQLFATPLTENRFIQLPTTNLFKGQTFSIVRKDTAPSVLLIREVGGTVVGSFNRTISGTITVVYDGAVWQKIVDSPKLDKSYNAIDNTKDVYTIVNDIVEYISGITYSISFISTNTTKTPTIEFGNLGPKVIVNFDLSTLEIGTLPKEAILRYEGGNDIVLLNPGIHNKKLCSAWANFSGLTTPIIYDSFNVLSITRDAIGLYTINFNNFVNTATYVVVGNARTGTTIQLISSYSETIDSMGIVVRGTNNIAQDAEDVNVVIFGD